MVIQVAKYFGRPGAGNTIFLVLDKLAPQVKAPGSGCSLDHICWLICNPENSFLYKRFPDEASLAAHLASPISNKSKAHPWNIGRAHTIPLLWLNCHLVPKRLFSDQL